MQTIIEDAATAATQHILEAMPSWPADEGRIAAFLMMVISAAIEAAIVIDRQQMTTPSNN